MASAPTTGPAGGVHSDGTSANGFDWPPPIPPCEPTSSSKAATWSVSVHYEDAQLKALKIALLFAALIVLASFWATRRLPTRRFDELQPAPT